MGCFKEYIILNTHLGFYSGQYCGNIAFTSDIQEAKKYDKIEKVYKDLSMNENNIYKQMRKLSITLKTERIIIKD